MLTFAIVGKVQKIYEPFVQNLSQKWRIDIAPIDLKNSREKEKYQVILNDTSFDFKEGDTVLFYAKVVPVYKSTAYELQCINFQTLHSKTLKG